MKWLKLGAVILGAVTITALGIDASDTLNGKSGTMLGQLIEVESGVCPKGMVEVPTANSFTCIDIYEASTGEKCTVANPKNPADTLENVNNMECTARSQVGVEPWRFVTREQAAAVCARAGKRLPKANEWYQAAVGMVDSGENCNIDSNGPDLTGENESCASAVGVQDLVGNVWEWVNGDVIEGQYNGRKLPSEGYVGQVDGGGVPTLTTEKPSELFNEDYFWSDETGAYGILRGGFYGSEEDAGIYAVHAKTLPTSAGTAIGFRCVK